MMASRSITNRRTTDIDPVRSGRKIERNPIIGLRHSIASARPGRILEVTKIDCPLVAGPRDGRSRPLRALGNAPKSERLDHAG